jgi:hypothetical protein
MKKFLLLISVIFLSLTIAYSQTTTLQKTKNTKYCFDKNKNFEILNSKRGITEQSSDKDTTKCNGWTIPQTIILSIIKDSKVISGGEWHDDFGVYRCIITGQLRQNELTYKYEINGGSWIYIFCNQQTIILGSYKKEYEKYFIDKAWTGE